VENVCQALARCVIGEQMLKISEKYKVALTVHDLQKEIEKKLAYARMPGDFRIEAIQTCWKETFEKKVDHPFLKLTLRVVCASGTYMRTLAEELAKKISTYGFALHIRRIGIHDKK
jgi:tRNA U55 pseudouridine synthase TruB